jgi:hypothetical protein
MSKIVIVRLNELFPTTFISLYLSLCSSQFLCLFIHAHIIRQVKDWWLNQEILVH